MFTLSYFATDPNAENVRYIPYPNSPQELVVCSWSAPGHLTHHRCDLTNGN